VATSIRTRSKIEEGHDFGRGPLSWPVVGDLSPLITGEPMGP